MRAGKYPEAKYYISREANDILKKLINGLLGLIYVYHDNFQGRHPLLPWLHSTEICKHVFAECWKLIKDFTHLNFIFMNTQLHALLRASLALARGIDPKAQANGYSHVYLDPETAQMGSLTVFPSNKEIEIVAGQAWDEAIALLSLIRVESSDIDNSGSNSQTKPPGTVPNSSKESDDGLNLQDESDHGIKDPCKDESDATQLRQLIGVQETGDWKTVNRALKEKMHVLTCAAMALDINDMETL